MQDWAGLGHKNVANSYSLCLFFLLISAETILEKLIKIVTHIFFFSIIITIIRLSALVNT